MRVRNRTHRHEDGSVLVLALIIALLLTATAVVATSVTTSSLGLSTESTSSSQAALASQSGLATELASMRNVSSYTSLPCSLSGSLSAPGASSSYSVSVAYSANGSGLACTGAGSTLGGGTAPTSATLTSTGQATHGASTVMKQDVGIATTTLYDTALGYAIFTENNLDLTNAATLYASGGNAPNIYVGQTLTCNNGTLSQGSVITYQPVSLSNDCTVDGGLVSSGAVTMANSAIVGGAVTSYAGGITMTGNAHIGGNAVAAGTVPANDTISLSNSATIAGTAQAVGTISVSGGSTITGTQTPGDSVLESQTMPSGVSWPTINPSYSDWQADPGWTAYQVPNSTYTCAQYFKSNSDGSNDPFMQMIEQTPTPLAIYAPTCAVTFKNTHVFNLNANIVLQVQSLTLNNSNTFQSTSSTTQLFSILANSGATASTSTVDVSLSNSTDFTSTVNTFIYTPGQVDYANAPSMTGQILAEGGFTGENAFVLTFSPAAAESLPGTGTPLPPTISPTDKYVVSGL